MASITKTAEPMLDAPADELLCSNVLAVMRAALHPEDPGHRLTVTPLAPTAFAVRLVVRHRVSFEREIAQRTGPLPDDVLDVGSQERLGAGIERLYAEVVGEAGGLMDAWIAQEGQDYRSVLRPDQCGRARPLLGFQLVCAKCRGEAHLVCPACGGQRKTTCGACGGRGRVACATCGGSGSTTCPNCYGSGTREVREFELSPMDAQHTMNQQRQLTRRVPCGCAGGRVPCSCGSGLVVCGGCLGSGIVSCGHCGASGSVPCDGCDATGAVHVRGRIVCSVSHTADVTPSTDDVEDQRTIRECVPIAELGELMGLHLADPRRNGLDLALGYQGQVAQQCAEIRFGSERVLIRSYGPQRRVFDYHDLVGRWLTPDVVELEEVLRQGARVPLRVATALVDGVTRVVGTEVNVRIARGAAQGVEEFQHAGLVSSAYVDRASKALSRAMPRLYLGQLLQRAIWLPLAAAGAMLVTYTGVTAWANHAHFIPWSRFRFAEIGAVLFGGAWVLLELQTVSALKHLLGASLYERVAAAFGAPRRRARWAAVVVIVLLAWMYGYLPRAIHQALYHW